jgi:cystathionine beta-lyase
MSMSNGLSEDFDARRLENAVWRMRCATPSHIKKTNSEGDLSENFFLRKVQDTIGECVQFPNIRFPQEGRTCEYDDLPTFPIRPNFANFKNNLRPASECVVFDGCPDDPYHPSNTPIYQTATFVQPSANEFGAYDYTRSGNPTRTALEKHVAMLEQAAASFAFASGMAALHTVTRLLHAGDQILCNEDIYGGMHRLLSQDVAHNGVQVTFVDTTDLDSVARAITRKTKLIHTESPSNPRMRITDLRALAELAHRHGVLLSVDSTMMPPVICKPLTLGVDIVTHSATKFFSGHADCTGGLVSVKSPDLAHRIAFLQNAQGTALAPFECFLFLRGMKTMFLRVERAISNAKEVGNFLLRHRSVKQVLFPIKGGCDAKSLAIHQSQCDGAGSVISFTTGSVEFSRRLLDACRLFKCTVSFGSVNSLGEMPCTMSHASIPAEKRTLPDDLIRLSVGIEDIQDLLADLKHAFELAEQDVPLDRDHGYDSKFADLPMVPKLPKCVVSQLRCSETPSTQVPSSGPGSEHGSSAPGGDSDREFPKTRKSQQASGSGILAAAPWQLALLAGAAVFFTWRHRINTAR